MGLILVHGTGSKCGFQGTVSTWLTVLCRQRPQLNEGGEMKEAEKGCELPKMVLPGKPENRCSKYLIGILTTWRGCGMAMSNNHPFQLMTDQMRQDAYEVNKVKGVSHQVTESNERIGMVQSRCIDGTNHVCHKHGWMMMRILLHKSNCHHIQDKEMKKACTSRRARSRGSVNR